MLRACVRVLLPFVATCCAYSRSCVPCVCPAQSDLEHKRAVELEEAAAYAAENHILHLETSAKNAKNVKQLFVEIARKLPKNPPEAAREAFPIIPPKDQKKAGGCC